MEIEGEEASSKGWSCATNWTVAKGSSLETSISFDTSDEDAPDLTSNGTLLLRPASDDPPPCEVTVFFKGKHEIHRVYARTTGRIFEIYYTKDADRNSTKEYLCTVKCGPASSDENLQGSSQNSSVHSSEEGSWVDVKAPASPLKETQMHYEATAEISDAEPCASLTLRFLSLQTKSSVHVEEIYIYVDPIDESNTTQVSSSSTTGNSNASSLFAMLVPNLLQMSKSGLSSRINERYFSPDRIHNTDDAKDQNTELDTSITEEPRREAVYHTEEKNNYQTQTETLYHQAEIPVNTTLPSLVESQCSTSPYKSHARNSSKADIRQVDQEAAVNTDRVKVGPTSNEDKSVTNESANRIEKILEQLVFKVEKIETYFAMFEEKMASPIICIESRLERLENQFNLLTKDLQSMRVPPREPCSRATDEIEKSQDPVSPDDSIADGVAGCQVETKKSAGTTFKAPDCMSEDESDDDDVHNGNDDARHDDMEVDTHLPNKRKPISIDGALASALAAFATESCPNISTVRSDKMNDPDLVEDTEQIDVVPGGEPFPGGEGVPLVSIDEVKIEVDSDLLSSLEAVTHTDRNYNEVGEETTNLDENLHRVDARDITSEVGPTEENFEGSDIHTLEAVTDIGGNLDENLHRVDGDMNSDVVPTEGTREDSDIHSQIKPGLFSKSVIGEVSDEEEVEPGFAPDSPRFTCNSPLSSSDFEPSLPNYGGILNGWGNDSSSSTDSSFDESFLKTKTHINLSDDDINTDFGTFSEGASAQKVSVIWDEPKMLDPLTVLLDEMTVSDMHGSVSATTTALKEENTSVANDPFIDFENFPNTSEVGPTDSNMPQFESLI